MEEQERIKIDRKSIKIRKSWPDSFNPETKIEKPKTNYKRSSNKKEIEETLEQEELENSGPDNLDWLP